MIFSADRVEAAMLRRALLANAIYCGLCGLLVVIFDEQLVSLMSEVNRRLWPLGVLLVAYAGSMLWFTTRRTISTAWVTSVIVADIAWVVGTAVLLAVWHGAITAAGVWILLIVAAIVFLFAELQWVGLRKVRKAVA